MCSLTVLVTLCQFNYEQMEVLLVVLFSLPAMWHRQSLQHIGPGLWFSAVSGMPRVLPCANWILVATGIRAMSEIHVIQVTWLDLDSKIVVGSAKTLQGLPSKVRSKALLAFYPYCSCHFTVEQQPQSDKTKVSYRLFVVCVYNSSFHQYVSNY